MLSAASFHGRAVINNAREQALRADPDHLEALKKTQVQAVLESLSARLMAL